MNEAYNFVLDNPELVLVIGVPLISIIFGIGLYRTRSRSPSAAPTEISAAVLLTWMLILGGAGLAAYFFLFFDTSVAVPGGLGRVNNIGLLSDRQNGILIGLVAAVIGVILFVFRSRAD